MAIEITLPSLGDEIESGDVLEVLVSEGDVIEKDQGVVELETDKATVAVPSTHAGTVVKIHVSEGDTIPVGGVIISLEPSESMAKPSAAKPAPKTEKSKPKPKPSAPKESTAEPDPAMAPSPQPAESSTESVSSAPPVPVAGKSEGKGNVAAGPAIRRFAREVGVDLRAVKGTGIGGRISREDVLQVVRGGKGRAVAGKKTDQQTDKFGPIKTEKMSRVRQTIARKMHESWATVPRVTNFDDADVTDLEEFRQESKADYAAQGIKLTSMAFLIKAVAMSLRAHPVINATVDLDVGQVTYKEYINIGIAVDTERGLVVPSLRAADKLSIPDIAKQLGLMADNVRSNNFSIDDLRGGTFTISNLGAIGGTYSTPIINVPETAILLVGRSRKMPVVIDDKVAIRLMMPLSISYDHRLIDGGAAARFLNEVIGYLKAPSRLLLAP